jgi:hypothetical protein
MTVWVIRDGKLVDKHSLYIERPAASSFPTPHVSSMEPFISPIDDREITSWGARDRHMKEHDAFDYRDLSKDHQWRRGRDVQLKEAQEGKDDGSFEWRNA